MKATKKTALLLLTLFIVTSALPEEPQAPLRSWRRPSPGVLPAPILLDPELRECWTHVRRPPGCMSSIYDSSERGKVWLSQECCSAVKALSSRCFRRIFTDKPFKPEFSNEVQVFCACPAPASSLWFFFQVCSHKRVTISICLLNLLLSLYVLRSLFAVSSHSSGQDLFPVPNEDFWQTKERDRRVEESVAIRRALGPAELVSLWKTFSREDSYGAGRRRWLSPSMKRKLADEILQRLREVGTSSNVTQQREALALWHSEKLKALKLILSNSKVDTDMVAKEAKMLANALECDSVKLLEDIGLWIPSDVKNYEINDKPENATELEDDAILGPTLPTKCHVEPHTDYDGAAVRWGLTHHEATADDCCQACIDQAKHAKFGQMKCNIWVYCPSEFGCYSPDIYEHQHQECWLK